ncbi:hypothetical protein BT63DRAFT_405545 [Microthyrium microscopicum]|uniref:polynucleotide adenylyltransferase n=1 Tax=Microthyrium microscopicum TaxID=703497 RepID=A0A6A6U1R0_9PEZI|nr:hypothetical protein BT63DRAFT_405545 [Microthyrium microscopicum]
MTRTKAKKARDQAQIGKAGPGGKTAKTGPKPSGPLGQGKKKKQPPQPGNAANPLSNVHALPKKPANPNQNNQPKKSKAQKKIDRAARLAGQRSTQQAGAPHVPQMSLPTGPPTSFQGVSGPTGQSGYPSAGVGISSGPPGGTAANVAPGQPAFTFTNAPNSQPSFRGLNALAGPPGHLGFGSGSAPNGPPPGLPTRPAAGRSAFPGGRYNDGGRNTKDNRDRYVASEDRYSSRDRYNGDGDRYAPSDSRYASRGGYGERERDRYDNSHDRYTDNGDRHASAHGADTYRPAYGSNLPPRPSDQAFSFTFKGAADVKVPDFSSAPRGPRAERGNGLRRNNRPNNKGPKFPAPHSRAIFQAMNNRETTPERLSGMAEGAVRFIPKDELDQPDSDALDHDAKRRKLGNDADERPKWSNPDPYTALPPTFDPQAKRTDVVQLIRQAKVMVENAEASANALADNADFVAFDFDDDDGPSTDTRIGYENLPAAQPFAINSYPPPQQSADISRAPDGPASSRPKKSRPDKRKRQADGDIIPSWLSSGELATPWKREGGYATDMDDISWGLHCEIRDYFDYVEPRDFEDRVRQHLVTRVSRALCHDEFSSLKVFGSFASGLYLPTADMDLVLLSHRFESTGNPMMLNYSLMARCLNHLRRAGLVSEATRPEVITKAKVPIIKFCDADANLKVDISFDNLSGVTANQTYAKWKADYPDLKYLLAVVKQFLAMRELNEVFSGGIGGFSITCFVVSFLQHRPPGPPQNLGQLLLDFFDFWGNNFDMATTGVSVNPPKHFEKPKSQPGTRKPLIREKWYLVDPNDHMNDLTGGTKKAPLIQKCFSDAAASLKRSLLFLKGAPNANIKARHSILSCIIGGNYNTFDIQRKTMFDVDAQYADVSRQRY